MKHILRKFLGIVLIILGFVALVTPFSPGSWLMLIGLEILGFRFLLEGKLSRLLKSKHKGRFENSILKFRQHFRRESCQSEHQDEEQASG
jgi:hypothetical protein